MCSRVGQVYGERTARTGLFSPGIRCMLSSLYVAFLVFLLLLYWPAERSLAFLTA